MAKEFWLCAIGPVERAGLPWGSDFPMRQGVKDAFYNLTDEYADTCSSGWGTSEEMMRSLMSLNRLDTDSDKYKRIRAILDD